jgi:hypothetical protein
MRKLRHLLPILLLAPLAGGCDGLLDLDINEDPDAATEVSGDLLMPLAMASTASNRAMEIFDNTLISQIFASNGSAGVFLDPERYNISPFTTGNTWSIYYTDALKNLFLMRTQALAEEPARTNVAAQGEIFSAYVFWLLTALWETVPYTQALNGSEFPQPVFDDQETVLRGIVQKLDSALAMIDDSGPPGVASGDLVYGGDMARWERFANSLKLRSFMMIRNQDPSVDVEISALLNQPLIRENSHEAAVPFFDISGNENNVWKLNNLFGGFVNAMNGNGFIFAGETLVDLMKELNDPRLSTYFELAVEDFDIGPDGGGPGTDEYFGQRAGVAQYDDGETSMLSQNIVREDWPNRILPAAEVWFYEAEFRAQQNDLAGAHASYRVGVQRALDFFDGKPGAITPARKDAYLSSLPQTFSSQSQALEAIHAQQYIEVLDRSPENWTHWRRTKYPALPVPEQAALGAILRRYPMPPDEVSSNPNTPTDVPLDRPMWFEG